jgi:multiple sugar transport system permease protein
VATVQEIPLPVPVAEPGPRRRVKSQLPAALLLLAPALLILGIFHFFPLLYAFYISLHKWRFVNQGFVGLDNYQAALTSDALWLSLANTAFFVIMVVPTTMILALILSVMLFQRVRFLAAFRTIYFLPYITSSVAAAGVWAWIFNPQYGIANQMLRMTGIGPQRWLQEPSGILALAAGRFGILLPGWAHGPSLALVSIATMTIWSYLGFEIVIFLVGLSNIPAETYEAARVDGANPWQVVRSISIPLLSPSILLISIVTTIGSFQEFNRIYQMSTGANVGTRPGGPLGATQTLVVLVYNEFYQSLHVGYGAAIAFVLFLILLLLSLIQFGLARRWNTTAPHRTHIQGGAR